MSEMMNPLKMKYLGKDSERKDNRLDSRPPYNYYEMDVTIDGKSYIIVFETTTGVKMEYGIPDWKNPYNKIKFTAIFGPEERGKFESIAEEMQLEEDESIGKIGENVEINLDELVLDFKYGLYDPNSKRNYHPDDFPPYFEIYEQVMERLYQKKKNSLMQVRQKSLEGIEGLPTLEKDILPQLPELSQQERARKMYDRMMQSVLTGRYGLKEYGDFMRKLVETVKDGKVLISDEVITAMRNDSKFRTSESRHIRLFPQNSRNAIANSTVEKLGDIMKSSRETRFMVRGIEPVKPEFKDYIDEVYQKDSASTLGKLTDKDSIQNRINYDPKTGKRERLTRGEFYVGEDEQGNIIFIEEPDWLVEQEILIAEEQRGRKSELASRESRLQAAEKEAEKITEAERLVEQREDRSSEQDKDE